jgi:hypothetical protein
MAQAGSKTTAQVYTNRKGVERVSVSFDLSKLTEGKISKGLLAEAEAAIVTAQARKATQEA